MLLDITGGAIKAAVVPDRLRARVSGAYMVVNYGVRPLGALAGGLLGAAIGVRETLWIATVGAIARRALAAAVADHAHARAAGDGRVNLAVVDGFEIVRVEGDAGRALPGRLGVEGGRGADGAAPRRPRRRRPRRRRERAAHLLAAPGRRGRDAAPSARPHGRPRRPVLPRLRGRGGTAHARAGARRRAAGEHRAGPRRVAAGLGVRVFGRRLRARPAARRGRHRRAVCGRGRRARARAARHGRELVLPAPRCLAPLSGGGCRRALDDPVRPGALRHRRPARRRRRRRR